MKFGVGLPNYGRARTFEDIRHVALAAEELGYDSIWTTDHLIVPHADIEPYGTIFESLTTLAMLAPITQRVKLGTSILVLPQRNPVLAAKQIATIDAASGGRMIVGLGVGWNAEEYANLNANFKNRGKRLDEDIRLLRALWSNENANFRGKYTQVVQSVFSPLPAQKGNLPIWVGGNGDASWERAAKLGDSWHATGALPETIAQGIQRIREFKLARPLLISARLNVDLNPNTPQLYEYRGAKRRRISGTDDDVRATVREYAQAGLEYAVLVFPMADISITLAQMKRFINDVAPEFK